MPTINVKRFSRSKILETIDEEEPAQIIEAEEQFEADDKGYESIEDDFFEDLNNVNYVSATEILNNQKESEKAEKESEKNERKLDRMEKKQEKQEKKAKTIALFADDGTELLGKDKHLLIAKISQYRVLFPDQLKNFKVKKNATIEELQACLNECDAIVECDTVETFLTDSILQCLKMIEFASTKTKADISGLSDILKNNKQFAQLSKQLYLKYKIFSAVPPEAQMIMLVATSAYVCVGINNAKKQKTLESEKDCDLLFEEEVDSSLL